MRNRASLLRLGGPPTCRSLSARHPLSLARASVYRKGLLLSLRAIAIGEARQSRGVRDGSPRSRRDCFVAGAPRNDRNAASSWTSTPASAPARALRRGPLPPR